MVRVTLVEILNKELLPGSLRKRKSAGEGWQHKHDVYVDEVAVE